MTWVVVLNGPGSVGKTTLACAIQGMVPTPVLHVQMDAFLEMLPEAMQDAPETFSYRPGPGGVAIETGPAGARLIRGMHHAVAALAGQGSDLIFDTVAECADLDELRGLLAGRRCLFVGLHAPLAVLEAREWARGDRMIGLARAQVGRVHAGVRYDLELDLGTLSPDAGAKRILRELGL
jgi:chloramphenicol 3-O phosphotransferase